MAIQMRRGAWSQFDPTKMLPGEWAVILSGHPDTSNGQALYHCFAAGSVKQIATIEDAATIIANATEDIRDELTQDIASALAQVGAATNAANTATASANTATSAANAAAQAATSASEHAEAAIEAMGDISELAVPLMSKDVRGGAKLEEQGGLALRDGALGIGSLVQESDGYARGGLAEVTAKGHAEQVATTGKNLLPFSISSIKTNNTTGTWSGNAYEHNGITFSLRSDGSITVSGTATGTAILIINNRYTFGTKDAGTYTLSGYPSGAPGYLTLQYTDSSSRIVSLTGASGYASFTTDSEWALVGSNQNLYLAFASGAAITTPVTIYPQLELGSTATEYEPYSGGLPSPRPDWEQPIEVVRGRNLLDIAHLTPLYVSGTAIVGDGTLSINGNSDTNSYRISPPIESGIYTLSGTVNKPSRCILGYCDPNGENRVTVKDVANSAAGFTRATANLNIPSGKIPLVWLYDTSTDNTPTIWTNIQLEKGDRATPYVPYGHVWMEAQGKNLFGMYTILAAYQSGSSATIMSSIPDRMAIVAVNPSTMYTLQGTHVLTGTNQDDWIVSEHSTYPTVGSAGRRLVTSYDNNLSYIFTTSADTQYIAIKYANINRVNTGDTLATIQLELGSTATDYQPYYHSTTPIPLPDRGWVAGLRDGTADSLRLDGAGKCEWELETSEVVLDGTVNAVTYNSTGSMFQKQLNDMKAQSAQDILFNGLSNRYIGTTSTGEANWSNKSSGVIGTRGTTNWLCIKDTSYDNASDYNTWLSTHPVTVLFPLATPITEDCGYVDMPEISGECQVSIPELDEVGIKYFIDSAVTELARQWYARANSEYADRITALEQAVAELATS